MANPDYDLGAEELEARTQVLEGRGAGRRGVVSRDAGRLQFGRLVETKGEADNLATILRERYGLTVKNYQDKDALEAALYAAPSPRYLHLSTHGYFLPDDVLKERQRALWGALTRESLPDLGIEIRCSARGSRSRARIPR